MCVCFSYSTAVPVYCKVSLGNMHTQIVWFLWHVVHIKCNETKLFMYRSMYECLIQRITMVENEVTCEFNRKFTICCNNVFQHMTIKLFIIVHIPTSIIWAHHDYKGFIYCILLLLLMMIILTLGVLCIIVPYYWWHGVWVETLLCL